MIQLNELRIGNKVKSPIVPGAIGTVDGIIPRPKAISIDGVFTSENLEPIPLSPEILKTCGFENPKGSIFWHKNKISIIMPGSRGFENGRFYFNSWFIMEPPKYLHLLMNIHFFLTGSELTINIENVKV